MTYLVADSLPDEPAGLRFRRLVDSPGIAQLPAPARDAFGLIATQVERSLFALRSLDAGDWQAAREAYARFALERLPA